MAVEVEAKRTERVKPTEATKPGGLDEGDTAAVKNAADKVDAQKVSTKIDGAGDNFERDKAPTTSGLPIGMLTGRSSPIDSGEVVNRMRELGATGDGDAAKFDRSKFNGVLSSDPGAPFTGSGATGTSPVDSKIPIGDLAAMARYHQGEKDIKMLSEQKKKLEETLFSPRKDMPEHIRERHDQILNNELDRNYGLYKMTRGVMDKLAPTVDSYRNPLTIKGDDADPKKNWDAETRQRQANLLLEQPISTIHGDKYGKEKPTRAEVIDAAAKKYNLDPSVVAGVILQEQRDQSAKEDAADYGGATLGGRDNSIGLGQVLMSTAMKNNADVLSDTVSAADRKNLSRGEVARLLASDEHNIFATARYLRSVADMAPDAGRVPGSLSETRKQFPGFDPNGYGNVNWSDANIKAIASEYSSRPWDDRVFLPSGYPQFVLDAVRDVQRTGIFGR